MLAQLLACPIQHTCRPCFEQSWSMPRSSWDLIASLVLVLWYLIPLQRYLPSFPASFIAYVIKSLISCFEGAFRFPWRWESLRRRALCLTFFTELIYKYSTTLCPSIGVGGGGGLWFSGGDPPFLLGDSSPLFLAPLAICLLFSSFFSKMKSKFPSF